MRVGDRVTVTVLGERRTARVIDPCSPLGNVSVELDEGFTVDGVPFPIRHLYRDFSDVCPLERIDPTRVVREWEMTDPTEPLPGPFDHLREFVALSFALLAFFLLVLWLLT